MSKSALVCTAVAAVLAIVVVGWLKIGDSAGNWAVVESLPRQRNEQILSSQSNAAETELAQAADGEDADDGTDSDSPNPSSLLAGYLMTGNKADLDRASQLFPSDRLIMLQCALLADQPDSTSLDRLEAADPDNSLPNLIRASLLAESGNLMRFREELEKAMSKGKLDTGYHQRQALILDTIITDGLRDLDPAVYLGLDKDVVDRFGHAARALVDNPRLFGDEYESAGYAVAFAEKLRAMGGGRNAFGLAAGQLEIDVLRRLDPRDEYVVEGRTIGQRLAELDRRVPALGQRVEQYLDPLMSPTGDPVLRLQFFARVRSDGEVVALGWLAGKMDGK